MATAAMSPEALDLLQQYSIDVKDYAKATARYRTVMTEVLVPQKGEAVNDEVLAATRGAQETLRNAWQEYLASARLYFGRLAKGMVGDLVASHDATCIAKLPPPVLERTQELLAPPGKAEGSTGTGPPTPLETHVVPPTAVSGADVEAGTTATTIERIEDAAPESAAPAPAAPAELHIPAPGAVGLTGAVNPLSAPRSSSHLTNSVRSSGQASSIATMAPTATLTLPQRAEKMNDLCALLDKWYVRHEQTFELPDPEGLARLAAAAVASVSRLMRLLGLRVAYVCAGNSTFLRSFLGIPDTAQWVAQCGDRELLAEVEGFLNLVERMVGLLEEDPKAFPRIPFGWLYRVSAFVDPHDPMPVIPPKRRSQAIRVAIRLLQVAPPQATAVGMHTVLIRSCLAKGGATPEEMAVVVNLLLEMFDSPKTRQYIRISDISIMFAPFLETTTAPTPAAVQDHLIGLNLAKDMIVMMLSRWVGMLWISCETTALRALIDVLHLPGDLDRKMVIFTLFNRLLVRLAPHRGMTELDTWTGAEEDRRRRAATAASIGSPSDSVAGSTFPNASVMYDHYFDAGNPISTLDGGDDDFIPTTKALGYHVMDALLGRVLIMLSYHGLPMALIDMLQNANKSRIATEAASQLLQDIFVLMDTVLPKATVHGLHEAFNSAVGRLSNNGGLFLNGLTSQLFHSYKAARSLEGKGGLESSTLGGGGSGTNASPLITVAANSSETANSAVGTLDMDDPTFVFMLKETHVEQSPMDFKAWDFDKLLTLVQGPLRVNRRLRAAKGILKTLVAFYSPRDIRKMFFMRTFSSLKTDDVSSHMCVLGIELVDLLLSTREGTVLLDEASFPQGVAQMLKEVRIGKPLILTKERTSARIGQSLLRMVGRMSWYANGLILMRENGIFSIIDELFSKLRGSRVTEPQPEDTLQDVCYQLLQYLFLSAVPNYGVCEDIRHTIRQALRSSSNAIRLCAAMQLKKAVWRDLSTSMKWGIETLVQVLHDDFYNVVESAFKLLLSICLCSDEGLDYLISLFPTVLMESEMILSHAKRLHLDVLLYRITSRPSGFRFLQSYGWIEHELHRWESTESASYVQLIERLQASEADPRATLTDGLSANRSRHARSFSGGAFGASYPKSGGSPGSPASSSAGYLPLMTADAVVGANFFPTHFASVLCRSAEGCAMFKYSELWTRSMKRLLEQPLPPDIAYDNSLSDQSDSSDESDDDMNINIEEGTRMVPAKPASLTAAQENYGAVYGANSLSRADNSFMQGGAAFRRAVSLTASSVLGGSTGPAVPTVNGPGAANGSTASGVSNNVVGATASGCTVVRHANGVEEPQLTAGEMRQLLRGKLSKNESVLLSAARGYKSMGKAFSMDCVGDPATLKDALMVMCQVCATDAGSALVCSTPDLFKRLTAICRFASSMSVRCVGLIGTSVACRSKRASEELAKAGYIVMNSSTAYVSADGIPYAVAFAHMGPSRSMAIARRSVATNTVSRHAYADYAGGVDTSSIPRKVFESVVALANPVSREAAKALLYKIMKRHPHLFTNENVRRVCLDVSSTYRMRHTERKFLADLIENAQITAVTPSKGRHSRS